MNPVSSSVFGGLAILMCLVAIFINFGLYRDPACTDTLYVGTYEGQVAISRDGGETWSTVLTNTGWICSVKADGDHVYASTNYGPAISHDSGLLWSLKYLQTNSNRDSAVDSVYVDEEKRVYALLIGSNFGGGRVAISSDNGYTWPINFPLPNPPFTSYASNIYVDGARIYVAGHTGLGYTDDLGTSWTFRNKASGLGSNAVTCVIAKGQTIYAGLFMYGGCVSMSTDGGHSWKTMNTTPTGLGLPNFVCSMYLQGETLYVATMGSGLSFSNDFTTWTRKTTVDGLVSDDTQAIICSGNNLYLGTFDGLSISRDKGQTWITKTTKDGLPSNNILSVFAQCV